MCVLGGKAGGARRLVRDRCWLTTSSVVPHRWRGGWSGVIRATIPYMPDTRGHRLKVLAAGLHQVGAKCEKLGGELSATAVPSFVAASPWQASAGAPAR